MKHFLYLIALVFPFVFMSCNDGYDRSLCQSLSDKIVCDDSLSQDDYADMLDQYESILKYMIDRADDIIGTEDEAKRLELSRALRNDEDYLERFGFMFTFGSTLYQADVRNELDDANSATYRSLESYVEEFANRSEQI